MRGFLGHDVLPMVRQKEVDALFARLPGRFKTEIQRSYKRRLLDDYGNAFVALEESIQDLASGAINYNSSDYELREFAKARADECFRIASRHIDADMALENMAAVALRYGILPPGDNVTKKGQRARLMCSKWWRRAVRCYVGRRVEGAAVTLGLVHRRAGLYASNETVSRRTLQKKKNRQLLESIKAVNEAQPEGKRNEYTLAELSDLGVSNPEIRRMELMTRLAGFDALAKEQGHAAEFYTITAPSAYHARHSQSGLQNPAYNGSTPRETQKYLTKTWAKIRAKLQRLKIRVYGFRVCEPHHDGTPHWHMVLFMQQQDVKAVRSVIAAYALQENPNEPGAKKHRFTYKAIDRSKGNAAGYLAKYIAKNIDGYNVGEDYEGAADSVDSAKRVEAWAACWGIRQFQQIGGAPVTVWRELRRMDAESATDLFMKAIITAADSGNWTVYTQLQGGGFAKRSDYEVTSYRVGGIDVTTGEMTFNAYGEIAGAVLKGVCYNGEQITTRAGVWVFQRGGAAVTTWSSVNNCTGGRNFLTDIDAPMAGDLPVFFEKTEFFTGEKLEKWQRGEKDEVKSEKRFAPPPECARVLGGFGLQRGAGL
jgi:hypothetical protein